MAEVHEAAGAAQEGVQRAFIAYQEHKTAANLRTLEIAIQNMTPNINFAAKSLSEHAENVVQLERAGVEAFVVEKARQLQLDPAEIGFPELEAGGEP